MPGFLGGGSSSGSSGEFKFPKEFIDPVTKLRVSQPENLIDTDFEYGLQPTKWETVELINNTPSFFSKSGDTTIDGIVSITTNSGTREITVVTALSHNLAVGIPIQVTGTKSITADGSYIINSIPNATTFTYLCKDNQLTTASIEDLYSSIITGEFFQGSQLRISDDDGIVTNAASPSVLTVTTDSTHGFKTGTPFYFLNLNSTISQEFQAANTASKSFDASNSATAQTFDGSNALSKLSIDFSNSAVIGGITSTITSAVAAADTITVAHGTENFVGKVLGTPLYYDVVAGSGFFNSNPRGVVFLKTTTSLGTTESTFQVSELPDGDPINITGAMTGTFQLANQARVFAGNNSNAVTEQSLVIVNDAPKEFDATGAAGNIATIQSYDNNLITITTDSGLADLNWYPNAMVVLTGSPLPAQLSADTTYWVQQYIPIGTSNSYVISLKPLPNGSAITGYPTSTGSGAKLQKIAMSIDKDIFHIKDNGFAASDMVRYDYPTDARFTASSVDETKDFYFVSTVYDTHNFQLNYSVGEVSPLTINRVGTDAGTAISATNMTAVGFGAGLTFAVTSGTLPTGLTLNTTTGVVSGTPSEVIASPGREVIVTATDSSGATASQIHTYQFNQPPQIYAFTSATFSTYQRRTGVSLAEARAILGNPAWANTYLEMPWYTGYQVWTIPANGTYRIRVAGAGYDSGTWGAVMQADMSLTQGEKLVITCGSRTPSGAPSQNGQGASSVAIYNAGNPTASVPLIVAGGGGGTYSGANGFTVASVNRRPLSITAWSYFGAAFVEGYGGWSYDSGGGGGWYSNAQNNRGQTRGGYGWVNGFDGGGLSQGDGGFGGGGGYHSGYNASGAGGGWTGGQGGGPYGETNQSSGGGASYVDTARATNILTSNAGLAGSGNAGETRIGEGYVTITRL